MCQLHKQNAYHIKQQVNLNFKQIILLLELLVELFHSV